MDQTCLLWRNENSSCADSTGSCLIYDNFSMSIYVLVILFSWRLAGLLLFGVARYYNKWSKVKEEEDDSEVVDDQQSKV